MNIPMHKKVFEVRPYGINSLGHFLEMKVERARKTSQGTQTMES